MREWDLHLANVGSERTATASTPPGDHVEFKPVAAGYFGVRRWASASFIGAPETAMALSNGLSMSRMT